MNIPKKTIYIGIGVLAVLGFVWYNKQQKAKKEAERLASLKAKITAEKMPLTETNAPDVAPIALNQTGGKLTTK